MSTTEDQPHLPSAGEDDFELVWLVKRFVQLFAFFFFGYLVGYVGFSIWWISITAFVMVIREKKSMEQMRRLKLQRAMCVDEKSVIQPTITDLPSWVYFPDTERAEWVV